MRARVDFQNTLFFSNDSMPIYYKPLESNLVALVSNTVFVRGISEPWLEALYYLMYSYVRLHSPT